jgi:two-component SAPR family response regulator
MELKCIIIDDEPWASLLLVNFVKRTENMTLLNTFETLTSGFDYLKSINYEVDVVFLDVQLNHESSIVYLAETGEDKMVNIVFTSAFRALQFQDKNIEYVEWLQKPIPYQSFEDAVEMIRKKKSL